MTYELQKQIDRANLLVPVKPKMMIVKSNIQKVIKNNKVMKTGKYVIGK